MKKSLRTLFSRTRTNLMKTILCIFGTRPDTIKMAPVISELRKYPNEFKVVTAATGQHRRMLDQVLQVFDIRPDFDLNIMEKGQTLSQITGRTVEGLDSIVARVKPDMVLIQGDTSTTFLASLVAFYHKAAVGHVEAGLRTFDKYNPFPEEINRRLTAHIADLHFAPTETAKKTLLKEHIKPEAIFVTGNTVIDALKDTVQPDYRFVSAQVQEIAEASNRGNKVVLVTAHRRENWGQPIHSICRAVRLLAEGHREVIFAFPVHENPEIRKVVFDVLTGMPNVKLLETLNYKEFVNLLNLCFFVLTDSGGLQEEAPSLGKPVLVLRKVTERPEAIKAGSVKLIGLEAEKIYSEARKLIEDTRAYRKMATNVNPYGDGKSAARIVEAIRWHFGFQKKRPSDFKPKIK